MTDLVGKKETADLRNLLTKAKLLRTEICQHNLLTKSKTAENRNLPTQSADKADDINYKSADDGKACRLDGSHNC